MIYELYTMAVWICQIRSILCHFKSCHILNLETGENHRSAVGHWQTLSHKENHRPAVSHWQTLSHNVVSNTNFEVWVILIIYYITVTVRWRTPRIEKFEDTEGIKEQVLIVRLLFAWIINKCLSCVYWHLKTFLVESKNKILKFVRRKHINGIR